MSSADNLFRLIDECTEDAANDLMARVSSGVRIIVRERIEALEAAAVLTRSSQATMARDAQILRSRLLGSVMEIPEELGNDLNAFLLRVERQGVIR